MAKRLGCLVLMVLLVILAPAQAQQSVYPVITAENIRDLQSAQQIDFVTLPDDLVAASGLFVINSDASKIVTFGNEAGGPPLSRAILWGYSENLSVVPITDGSIFRTLSGDGACLYTGYQGYVEVYHLDADEDTPVRMNLNAATDFVNELWLEDPSICSDTFYVEVTDVLGQTAVWQLNMAESDATPILGYDHLFNVPDKEMAARVGRVPPPFALTMDFDGNLYRWSMAHNTLTATVPVGELAMFGAINQYGTHYVWLTQDYDALHLVDFEAQSDREVASLGEGFYISHLKLTNRADVIIGVDPKDASGTVSAWLVETSERVDLGPYRQCNRIQPDLVQLSSDGTSLVIGCDTGLDIWRVVAN
ncbi:MAG: hypothetical protein HY862_14035 [Chloroflexi bacterium]|nr:hypothetical protein [Chloroflexota bacterium]